MYYLSDLCYVCIKNKKKMSHFMDVDDTNLTYYAKIISVVPELNNETMNRFKHLCDECIQLLKIAHSFRKTCLRNTVIFENYSALLKSSDNVSGKLNIVLDDIKNDFIRRNGFRRDIEAHSKDLCEDTIENHDIIEEDNNGGGNPKNIEEEILVNIKLEPIIDSVLDKEVFNKKGEEINEKFSENVNTAGSTPSLTDSEIFHNSIICKEEFNQENEEIDEYIVRNTDSYHAVNSEEKIFTDFIETSWNKNPTEENERIEGYMVKNESSDIEDYEQIEEGNLMEVIKHEPSIDTIIPDTHLEYLDSNDNASEIETVGFVSEEQVKDSTTSTDSSLGVTLHEPESSSDVIDLTEDEIYKLKCNICDEKFDGIGDLEGHIQISHQCSICGKNPLEYNEQDTHIHTYAVNMISVQNPLIQQSQTQTFTESNEVDTSVQSFPNSTYIVEKINEPKVYSKTFNMTVSRFRQNFTGPRPYECGICKKRYTCNGSLTRHMRRHSGEKPYECEICKKRFTSSGGLTGHIRIHAEEKPYDCEICYKSFRSYGNLIMHTRTHTGERPFECEICKKGFTTNSYRIIHLRTHTGDKPYECEICKKRFNRVSALKQHVRLHTGEKPFECQICNERFTNSEKFRIHRLTHTGEMPFKCKYCNETFAKKCRRDKHRCPLASTADSQDEIIIP